MKLTWFRALILGILVATLVVPAGALQAMAPPQSGQQPPKRPPEPPRPQDEYAISVDVPLVNVDVVVTDNNGTFIPGLKKDNFRILEDGIPQTITNFAPTDAPITVVILLEFSKIGYRYFSYSYQGQDWAYEFLSQLGKDDWVALISFDLKSTIEVDFTKNKHEVRQHLSRMYYPNFTEASLFSAVIDTVDRLKDVKGKKAVLLLATGMDTHLGKHTLDDALKTLRQTDVTIFSVGTGRDIVEYLDSMGGVGPIYRLDYQQGQNQLNAFARMTGGRAWFPRFRGELPGILRDVAGHLRNQYSVGYVPSNNKRDGKTRKIKVELVGPDGTPLIVMDQRNKKVKYQVYAREGYVVPKGVS